MSDDRTGWDDAQELELALGLSDVRYVLRLEPDLGWEHVSGSVTELVGYTPQEHYDDPGLGSSLVDPRDRDRLDATASWSIGPLYELTLRWRARDGGVVWTEHRCRKLQRPDGSVVLHGVARDVTARVAAEQALAESEARFRLLAGSSSDVVFDIGTDDRYRWVSPSARQVLGWEPEAMVGRSAVDHVHPDDLPRIIAARTHPVDGTASVDEFRFRRADGSYVWVSGRSRVLTDEAGEVVGRTVDLRDVHEQVESHAAVVESEARLRLLLENSTDVVFRADVLGQLEWVSPSVLRLTGWEPEELVGRSAMELLVVEHRSGADSVVDAVLRGEHASYEGRLDEAFGHRWVSVNISPVRDDEGRVVGSVGNVRDVQGQVEARAALARSERRFRLAMDSAPTGMALVDLDRRFTEVNPALCAMVGRDREWLLAHRLPDVLDPADEALDLHTRATLLSGGAASGTDDKRMRRADGTTLWVEHSIGLLHDDDGLPSSYVSQFVDVTSSRHVQNRLRYQATHDSLTHLANRRDLFARLRAIAARRAPPGAEPDQDVVTGSGLALLFLDVDQLKPVNDTYGHATGDRVLVEVARRITDQVGQEGIVARFGGDEFVVALPHVNGIDAAREMADAIHGSMLGAVSADGHLVRVSLSIGIAWAEPGEAVDLALAHADAALYRAKRDGRARSAVYDPTTDVQGSVSRHIRAVGPQERGRAVTGRRSRASTTSGESLVDERYLELLRSGDARAAVDHARRLGATGIPPDQLLVGLVSRSQEAVGDAWLANTWTIADEHIATSVNEQVQAIIVADAMAAGLVEDDRQVQVLVASAEGDPHELASRLVADRLRLAGVRAVHLGAATSERLRELIHGWQPDAVVLSCVVARNLVGLARSIAAVRDAGCPVIAGGRAVSDQSLASALGADRFAASFDDLLRLLTDDLSALQPLLPRAAVVPVAVDDQLRSRITDALARGFMANARGAGSLDAWGLAEVMENLEHLVRTLDVALQVGRPSLFVEHVAWMARFLTHRGEVPDVLAAALVAAREEVVPRHDAIAALLDEGVAQLAVDGPG